MPESSTKTPSSVEFIVDTSKFSSEDLELFLSSSKFIEETRERRRLSQTSLNNMKSVHKSREEIFEVAELTEKEFCEIAVNDYDDISTNIKNLSADIEKLLEDLDDCESGCCSAESDVELNSGKNTLERKVVNPPEKKSIVVKPKSNVIETKRVTKSSVIKESLPLLKSSFTEKWPPMQINSSTVNKADLTSLNRQVVITKAKCWPPSLQVEKTSTKQEPTTLKVKDLISLFNELSSQDRNCKAGNIKWNDKKPKSGVLSKKSMTEVIADNHNKLPKSKIILNKDITKTKPETLSNKIGTASKLSISRTHKSVETVHASIRNSARKEKETPIMQKSVEPTKNSNRNVVKTNRTILKAQETTKPFSALTIASTKKPAENQNVFETRSNTFIVKTSKELELNKDIARKTAASPKTPTNLVKNRVNQFESAGQDGTNKKSVKSTIKRKGSHLRDLAKNSVRRIKALFEHTSTNTKPSTNSKQTKTAKEKTETKKLPLSSTKTNKQDASELYAKLNKVRKSPNPVATQSQPCNEPRRKTLHTTNTLSPDISTAPVIPSRIRASFPGRESTPKQLKDAFHAFAESQKASEQLCSIVATIRQIRHQGLEDVSRDLFHIFKTCLRAANEKLADPNQQQIPISEMIGSKKVAAVKPTMNTTYPRVLRVIPKKRFTNFKLCPETFRKEMKLKGLDESNLTYERFVSILGQTPCGRI